MSINGGGSGHAVLTDAPDVRGDRAIARLSTVIDVVEPASTASDWAGDPHSRGAYSFLTPGSSRADLEALGEPAHCRVLFAGEATSPDRHGYVDGALSSGLREARRLLGAPQVTLTLPGWAVPSGRPPLRP
jgi:polyamine oxidase